MKNVKIRKRKHDYWSILEDYMALELSNSQIASKYGMEAKMLEEFLARFWKKMLNARESRLLIMTKNSPKLFDSMSKEFLESQRINEAFLELLSGNEDPLTDNELLFCNLLVETGSIPNAIKGAGLDAGLRAGRKMDETALSNAMRLRGMYLRKKKNIADYIYSLQQERNEVLKNSKNFLEGTLVSQIAHMVSRNNPREAASITKCLELLAKLTGDLDNKTTLELVNGDSSLDRIFAKAKEAKKGAIIETDTG